jgi:hypothetical protein
MSIRQLDTFHSQLVKELVNQSLGCAICQHIILFLDPKDSRQPRRGRVLEQKSNEGNSHLIGTWTEDLAEWVGLDLGEFVLHVLVVSFSSLANISAEVLTLGFIVLICSLVGVPRTLMISTN